MFIIFSIVHRVTIAINFRIIISVILISFLQTNYHFNLLIHFLSLVFPLTSLSLSLFWFDGAVLQGLSFDKDQWLHIIYLYIPNQAQHNMFPS